MFKNGGQQQNSGKFTARKEGQHLAWRLKMQALPDTRVLYGWMSG